MAAPDDPALMRRDRWLVGIATAAATLPLLVALVRAAREGWYPSGDNAYFSLRARDVLTEHHPLLGTWTSASLTAGTDVNNPGPLLFDLLAVPSKVDHRIGVAVGATLVNVAAIAGMVGAGWSFGGRRVALLAAAMGAGLAWALGSGLLVEPWQPHSLLLVALCFFVLVWGVVDGRSLLWPWAIAVGSLLVQTHLSYAYLVPGLCLVALVALWRRRAPDPWAAGGAGRHVVIGVGVGLVLWAQPLADQVAGRGNLGALVRSVGGDAATTGWGFGARLTATVLAAPGLWGREGFGPAFVPEPLQAPGLAGPDVALQQVPSAGAAALGLAVLGLLVAGAALVARRAGDGVALHGLVAAAVATLLGYVTVATLPLGPLGLGPHQLRFLWPLGVFLTGVVILALIGRARTWAPGVTVAAVGFGLLNVPGHGAPIGPSSETDAIALLDRLVPQLDALDPNVVYLVESEESRLFEPYTTPLMLELQARGIEFTASYVYTVPQVGERRREEGQAEATLAVAEGPGALTPPAGREVVAVVEGLGRAEKAELERLDERVRASVAVEGLSLTADGAVALEVGLLPVLAAAGEGPLPVDDLVGTGELGRMVTRGYVDLSGPLGDELERWADLRARWHEGTVAVWRGPAPVGG